MGKIPNSKQVFVQTFGKYVSWLSGPFDCKDECLSIFSALQNGTRQIQTLCAFSKANLAQYFNNCSFF